MSRIIAPRRNLGTTLQGAGDGDGYLDRVAKYIPAEVVGIYLALQAIIVSGGGDDTTKRVLFIIAAVVLAGLTPLYIRRLALEQKAPWTMQAGIATVSFVVWVYALGALPAAFGFYNGTIAGVVLLLFSAVVGLFQPSEGQK